MPRKKLRLSPLTRQRLDRLRERRPRAAPVPDPSDHRFRRWVVGLTEDAMHKEICARLANRSTLIREALMSWPHDYLGDEKARFPSFFEFLERITIDEPVISAEGTSIPFLQLPSQFLSRPNPEAPLNSIELTSEAFEKEFFHSWLFRPFPYEGCSLVEYNQLLSALRDRQRIGPQRRNALRSLLAQGPTLELAGQQYTIPPDWSKRLSTTLPPNEVARLLLAKQWGHDLQAVKEILVRLRKEAPIASAWTAYEEYLRQDPVRLREVYLIVSREPSAIGWPRTWPVPGPTTPL